MKRYLSPPATFLALWALALLFIGSPASAQTAGLGTLGLDNFLAETTGTVVSEDFSSLIDVDGNIALPVLPPEVTYILPTQSISLGQLSYGGPTFGINGTTFDDDLIILGFSSPLGDPIPLVLELDPDLGKLEGFFVETGFLSISLFDGDTLIDTFSGNTAETNADPNAGQIGWINTQGLNVTRVEFSSADPDDLTGGLSFTSEGGLIGSFKASFLPCPEPPAPPAEVLIPMIVEDIDELIESSDIGQGEGNPIKNFLQQALKDINKGKIGKALGKLDDANERVLDLIEDGSLSPAEGQALLDAIQSIILDLFDV